MKEDDDLFWWKVKTWSNYCLGKQYLLLCKLLIVSGWILSIETGDEKLWYETPDVLVYKKNGIEWRIEKPKRTETIPNWKEIILTTKNYQQWYNIDLLN